GASAGSPTDGERESHRGLLPLVRAEGPALQLLHEALLKRTLGEAWVVDPQLLHLSVVADDELDRNAVGEPWRALRLLGEAGVERPLPLGNHRLDGAAVELGLDAHIVRIVVRSARTGPRPEPSHAGAACRRPLPALV